MAEKKQHNDPAASGRKFAHPGSVHRDMSFENFMAQKGAPTMASQTCRFRSISDAKKTVC